MRRIGALIALIWSLTACATVPPTVQPTATAPSPTLTRATAPAATRPVVSPAGRPLSAVTPGVIITARAADVCTRGWAAAHRRSLTASQRRYVRAAYHVPAGVRVAEYDHLVALELGGGNGTGNIWPELSRTDAARKDRLEDSLHRRVCVGALPLRVAQVRVRSFWLWW